MMLNICLGIWKNNFLLIIYKNMKLIYKNMKYIRKYTEYIFEKFVETKSNTSNLYKDDFLEVKVVKTFDSCKEQGKDTYWCSNKESGFYSHNISANMYRFNFSDGYKLRLTWDYITRSAAVDDYSGGTHWGSGGILNELFLGLRDKKRIDYVNIRPEDDSKPFEFNYNKGGAKQQMVDYINKIPSNVIKLVHEYQSKSSKEKDALFISLYKEINKINLTSLEFDEDRYYAYCVIEYNNKKYNIKIIGGYYISFSKDFKKDFKSKYAFHDPYNTLDKYLKDKIKEFQKSNNLFSNKGK